MRADVESENVRKLLTGAEIYSVGRAAGMGVLELTGAHGEDIGVHLQCAFRIVRDDQVVLGSRDMSYVRSGARKDAFDAFDTLYDDRAAILNRVLAKARPAVGAVHQGVAGTLTIEAAHGFGVQAFPDRSGGEESWRALVRGGPHYGYPAGLV
ncbi:hypothetical protein ABZ330_03240 [Streptomyces sp. NPDC006172]|uniref:hypothetical protein n=1 Tax=Streptomyces sp. NPDC006172 TaxID=3154470 RepID=UPI0033F6641D